MGVKKECGFADMTFHDKKYVAKNLVINVLGVLCMPLFLRWARRYSLPRLSKGKRLPRKCTLQLLTPYPGTIFHAPSHGAPLCIEPQKTLSDWS